MMLGQLLACHTVAGMRWCELGEQRRVNQSTQTCPHRFFGQSWKRDA